MTFISWNPEFDVGVERMNQEHRGLMDLMNRIYDRVHARAPKTEISMLLSNLGRATTVHFQHEEAHMGSIGYPGLKTHQRIHADLLDKFGRHLKEFEAGSGALSEGFFSFLRLWLSAHIMGIDKKYGAHGKKAA